MRMIVPFCLTLAACLFATGCKKDAPAPSDTGAPPPAAANNAVPPSGLSSVEKCRWTFARNCALPCEAAAARGEKDPEKLRQKNEACMKSCLEKAQASSGCK